MPSRLQTKVTAILLRPAFDTLLLAILAICAIQAFRYENHISAAWIFGETAFLLIVPITLWFGVSHRLRKASSIDSTTIHWLRALAVLYSLLPVATQLIARQIGYGDSIEIVMLLMVQCAAWYLALFSAVHGFSRGAFVLFGAAVLLACYMSSQRSVFVFALLYYTTSLWWLMGNYWNRVAVKALDCESRTLPIRWSFFAVTGAILGLVGVFSWASGPIASTTGISGFMPTSGGNKWTGAYARSGLGDGDMLTAGDNATTTGAVDSDQFIEDNKSSIYDMMSEKFDEPVITKKERNRAVSLSGIAKHMHNVIQSEQSGKTFRTVRKPKRPEKDRIYENRISDALFFVEGSVPVRFTLATYDHFDGVDWKSEPANWDVHMNSLLQFEMIDDKPWYVVWNQERRFLQNYRHHKMKMMRLKTKVLPSPAFLKSWHIHRVDLPGLFDWGADGLVNIEGARIPSQTVINMVSGVPNYFVLRDTENLILPAHPNSTWEWFESWLNLGSRKGTIIGDHTVRHEIDSTPFVQLPKNNSLTLTKRLAEEWTSGIPFGFEQVEAIVSKFRSEFKVDNANVPPKDCQDTVGHFLDSGNGPTYLFATAAASVLRAAGYETRLSSGVLVQKKDYLPSSNQSVVTSENVHVWPEVCLEGWHWIPVEPVPGYPEPYNTMTWWQYFRTSLGSLGIWIGNHPIGFWTSVVAALAAMYFRKPIVLFWYWLIWKVGMVLFPFGNLQHSRRLLDARFRVAGLPRSFYVPISKWFNQIEPEFDHEFFRHWQLANFSSGYDLHDMRESASLASQKIIARLTYEKIRTFVKNGAGNGKKESEK